MNGIGFFLSWIFHVPLHQSANGWLVWDKNTHGPCTIARRAGTGAGKDAYVAGVVRDTCDDRYVLC